MREQCGRGFAWTKREVILLKKRFPTTADDRLAKQLGRTVESVTTMARKRLGLHKQPLWTPDRVKRLKRLYPDAFLHELEPIFGMTGSGIHYMAKFQSTHPYGVRLPLLKSVQATQNNEILGPHCLPRMLPSTKQPFLPKQGFQH